MGCDNNTLRLGPIITQSNGRSRDKSRLIEIKEDRGDGYRVTSFSKNRSECMSATTLSAVIFLRRLRAEGNWRSRMSIAELMHLGIKSEISPPDDLRDACSSFRLWNLYFIHHIFHAIRQNPPSARVGPNTYRFKEKNGISENGRVF